MRGRISRFSAHQAKTSPFPAPTSTRIFSSTSTRTAYGRLPTSLATSLKTRSSMFDGISSLARPAHDDEKWCMRDDEGRNERIGRPTAAVETWLIGMGRCINIPFWDRSKFSDRDGRREWKRLRSYYGRPRRGGDVTARLAEMSKDGDDNQHWTHVL
ncbi:hypothetical protein N657DRAFT_637435 [Parathielavia appendiculata]|uniref:Uncharacterized protein n=1 Tax=Parathielavia appendiculata TaxID=2587402 RepID=A0AAN6TS33_9PEZI|nr:hypothetical protein N657DRAFT_637435 [Parathielavia appendiculata]